MPASGTQSREDLDPRNLRLLSPEGDPEVIRAMPPMRSAALRGKVSDIALVLPLQGGVRQGILRNLWDSSNSIR